MTDSRRIARYAKLVDHEDVFAWLACGWMVHRDDAGWYPCNDGREGQYGTLLVWVCDCEMKRPTGTKGHEIFPLADDRPRYRTFSGVTTLGQLEQETDQQIPAPGYGALTGPIDRSANASHGLAGRPAKSPRAEATPTPAPSTKPADVPGSAVLGPNSGFDSRDGGQLQTCLRPASECPFTCGPRDCVRLQQETQRDYDEEGLYGWSINRRSGL